MGLFSVSQGIVKIGWDIIRTLMSAVTHYFVAITWDISYTVFFFNINY